MLRRNGDSCTLFRDRRVSQLAIRDFHAGRTRVADSSLDRIIGIQSARIEAHLSLPGLLLTYGNHRLDKGDFPFQIIRQLYRSLDKYIQRGDTVLDLGSGYGRVAFYGALLGRVKVVGIEIVEERRNEAERVRRELRLRQVRFCHGNVLDIKWPEAQIVVLMNSVCPRLMPAVVARLKVFASNRHLIVASHSTSNLFMERQKWLRQIVSQGTSKQRTGLQLFETVYGR
jgi:SAM-dependent methyltransferase